MSAGGNAGANRRRRSRSQRGDGPGLTHEVVVAAALARIDAHGLAAFSLRDVARDLGVYPTAVSWHVGSRDRLLADVVSLALADVVARPRRTTGRGWQREVGALMRRFRAALHRHPNVAPLLSAQLPSNAGVSLAIAEDALATLTAGGFAGADLLHAYNAILASMVGWVGLELAAAPADPEWVHRRRAGVADLDVSMYPTIAANRRLLGDRAFVLRWHSGATNPLDASFDALVDVLVRGLEEWRASRRRRRPG